MSESFSSNGDESERRKLISQSMEMERFKSSTAKFHAEGNVQEIDINHTNDDVKYVVYFTRWYVLVVFLLLFSVNNIVWNTWGPIEDTASYVFDLSQGQFVLLPNWSNIIFLFTGIFSPWIIQSQGLRVTVLLAGGLIVIGTGVTCIPLQPSIMIWCMHIGQIINGMASPLLVAATTVLSATWFPTEERTTATAISSSGNAMGVALAFLLGPWVVSNINATVYPTNLTTSGNFSDQYLDVKYKHLQEIRNLMYIELSVSAILFLAALIYFPAKPTTPPSASAVTKREDLKAGIIYNIKRKVFLIPALAYAISASVVSIWANLMVFMLKGKANQATCGWIGFWGNVTALVGAFFVGRCADYFVGKMKLIILSLSVSSCVAFIWIILLIMNYIPVNLGSLYASTILFGLFMNSSVPIFYEMTVEGAFPVGEETTTFMNGWLLGLLNTVFLFLPMIPSLALNISWMIWLMLGSLVICIVLLLSYKEQYNRLDVDLSR